MVKKEEFVFDSRDGQSKIHAVRWIPEGKVIGILQIVHGMAEYIERYEEMAHFFAEKGILVTGEDHLGHGKSVDEKETYGYFCEQDPATVVVRDVHRLKKMTQEDYPGPLYSAWTQYGFLYYKELPVPLWHRNSGSNHLRYRLTARRGGEIQQGTCCIPGTASWREAYSKADR